VTRLTSMNTATERRTGRSPRSLARITGALYLVTILTGTFAQGFVSERLVVSGDAVATANNILAHKRLFEFGFTVYMIEMACQIATTALFYELLKPAGKSVSLVAAFLCLAGCTIKTFSRVFYLAPLFILAGPQYLAVFSRDQLQAFASLFLKVNDRGAGMALAFFGFYALLTGWLMIRSTFLPRALGAVSVLAGLGWLTFLAPSFGSPLFPYIAGFGLVGALALIAWLLIVGVNNERWREQASVAAGFR